MDSSLQAGVSVIICCYNSASRIGVTLKHIALQKVPEQISWEVILVDNNSSDDTRTKALQEWEQHPVTVSFKIVPEEKAGLIYARQKGISEAKYDLLLFCDDDNWLEENYIRYAFEIMNSKSSVAILGGMSDGNFESEKPGWFDTFQNAYAIGKPLKQSGIANNRTYIAGAGMIIRKQLFELLDKLQFTPLLTGRKGSELLSGEDSEISLLALFLGYDLYYDERLKFTHFITGKRLSWKYCVSMIAWGHAIPKVYFEFYIFCRGKILDNNAILFGDAYKFILSNAVRRVIKSFSPIGQSVKRVLKQQPGSKKEIEIKAAFNKLKYLLFHKSRLRSEFDTMSSLMLRINQYKN
ncbi:MAG TPA: glycosyltransferase [Panacibacter sp.]|nr:glycosyltransferase [Panacibacter sp.]